MSLLQFIVILLVTYMVQSAPVDTCQKLHRQADDDTIAFYCAADLFKNNAIRLSKQMVTIALSSTENSSSIVLSQLFDQLTDMCKDFTTAMSLKHQLQDYLFNEYNLSLTTQQVKFTYSILLGLETAGSFLNRFHFNEHSLNCPRLSAAEYKRMYHVRYPNASLLEEMIDLGKGWVGVDYPVYKECRPAIRACS